MISRAQTILNHYGIYFEKDSHSGEWLYLCPFHDDHDIGSAFFNEEKEVYHCFSCNEGGNVYGFVAKMEDCEVKTAQTLIDNNFQPPGVYDAELTSKMVNRKVVTGITSAHYQLLVKKATERLLQACSDKIVPVDILQQVIVECCKISSLEDTEFDRRYKEVLERYTDLFVQINQE